MLKPFPYKYIWLGLLQVDGASLNPSPLAYNHILRKVLSFFLPQPYKYIIADEFEFVYWQNKQIDLKISFNFCVNRRGARAQKRVKELLIKSNSFCQIISIS